MAGAGAGELPASGVTSWRACLLAGAVHTLCFVLAFPPYDWWFLIFAAPLPLVMLALRTTDRRRAFVCVFVMSTLGFYWLDRWLVDITIAGYILMPPVQGSFAGCFVWLVARLRPRGKPPVLPGLTNVFLVPIVWVGLETFRGRILAGGYPWFLAGHPLIGAPVLCQSADLLGTYFISFLALMPAGFTADVLTVPLFHGGKLSRTIRNSLVFFVVMELVTIGYGVVSLKASDAQTGREVRIAAVQTNIEQNNKQGWTAEEEIEDFARFVRLTFALGGLDASGQPASASELPIEPAPDVDLIVWPETMVPGTGFNTAAVEATREFTSANGLNGEPFTVFHDSMSRVAQILGVPILVGASTVEGLTFEKVPPGIDGSTVEAPMYKRVWKDHYNSAVLINADGQQSPVRYDKLHLTPFGEVIPLFHRWPGVEKWLVSIGASGMAFDLSPGVRPERITVSLGSGEDGSEVETILVATPICFESAVSPVCRKLVYPKGQRKADVLINLTNDGWFGTMPGGREQHVQIGRFRCIENRVPMIRSANTGVSAAIDSSGRMVQFGPSRPSDASAAMSEGVMLATVRLDSRLTMYRILGDAFGWLCLGMTCLLIAAVAAAGALRSGRGGGATT